MFDQQIKSEDRELAGIQIEILNTKIVGVCRGATRRVLGHLSSRITNMTVKYLSLKKTKHAKYANVA